MKTPDGQPFIVGSAEDRENLSRFHAAKYLEKIHASAVDQELFFAGQQPPAENLSKLYAAMHNAVAEHTRNQQPGRAILVRKNIDAVERYVRDREIDLDLRKLEEVVSAGAVIDAYAWLDEFLTDGRLQEMETWCRDWCDALTNLEVVLQADEGKL